MLTTSLSLLLFVFLSRPSASQAQTSSAVCLPYYNWTSNSQNKTPCEVAASLIAVCNGGAFDVLPLDDGQHYQGPTLVANANPCMCNTVTYSLMTACGLCQGRSTLRWSEWSTNCPSVTFSSFPEELPVGLRVPAWAYYDVKEKDTFDQFLARDTANATESTATPRPTTTSEPESPPANTESSTAESATGTAEASEGESEEAEESEAPKVDAVKANRVGGAVIGSLLGAGLIGAGVGLYLRRQKSAAKVRVEKPVDETNQV